jgi:hypothetical protein
VGEVVSSHGQPLDAGARDLFETRFGYNFSHVRVHTGGKAAESAQAVNAAAYTVGRDLVFGAGQYAPQTSAGRRLLAHELAHTVQQTCPARQSLQRTEQKTLKVRGRPPMTVVIGELRFSKVAKADVLQFGALLPRSLSEYSARSREQSERNRDIMFHAKGLPSLPSQPRSVAAAEPARMAS